MRRQVGQGNAPERIAAGNESRGVLIVFWTLVTMSTYFAASPWAGFHGMLFASAGLLMAWRPGWVALPRTWWLLAIAFVTAGSACFLPAEWIGIPGWRRELEALGVATGSQGVIQARQALEMLMVYAVMLLGGLWLARHRADSGTLRVAAFLFTAGVAGYAVLARVLQDAGPGGAGGHFGFFPNRNHSGTYLAMGSLCGLGCVMQALRDKRFLLLVPALAATATCLWAVSAWSVSRGGVVLVAVGCSIWLPILGRRYLGRHGQWAIGLIILVAGGLFLIADSQVKERLRHTLANAGEVIPGKDAAAPDKSPAPLEKPGIESLESLDMRVPIHLDALGLIREFPWTGIGAGQFYYVFPQYRQRSVVAQGADVYHPESDWWWMASETGVPATLALLALVIMACGKSLRGIRSGRERALRSACLVAALLVPIHGLFDVPGHRITLAWSAALLFALSLQAPAETATPARAARWPFRLAALLLLAAASFLIRAEWFGGPVPATTSAQVSLDKVRELYQADLALQKAAKEKGGEYQPDPAEDKLEEALRIIDQAKASSPLNRDLPRHEAFIALHFDDKADRVDRAFAIDRALDPTWVQCTLRQAEALAVADPVRSSQLCEETLRRARVVGKLDPDGPWSDRAVLERIRRSAKGKPGLEAFLHQAPEP